MLDDVKRAREVSTAAWEAEVPKLRLELVELQRRLRETAAFPVVILVSGINCAGRSETVNLLNEWLDPRFLLTEAYWEPSPEERSRPPFWRYWRDLPPAGRIGIYMHAWYTQPMVRRFNGKLGRRAFLGHLERAAAFESTLAADGALILKLWLHLDRDRQETRLRALADDPLQRWRVAPMDWELSRHWGRFATLAEEALRRTSTDAAPWHLVDGADDRWRSLAVARLVRDRLRERLDGQPAVAAPAALDLPPGEKQATRSALDELDMTRSASEKDYRRRLAELQARVNRLARLAREEELPVVAVFEGWDASGKGGAVRRLTAAMDARDFRVVPITAPTGEERAHHYLWRFWRHLSRAGRMTLFDRSWYGRVLVERVEGFATEAEWRRAYGEIRDFESQLTEFGVVLLKFWLHVTDAEQLRRFEARRDTPYKSWKLTDEDWRNRAKRGAYEAAVAEMVARTSTGSAPWTLVEGDCKRFARLKVLETVADALDDALAGSPRRRKKGRG